jgi:hypothetical protein
MNNFSYESHVVSLRVDQLILTKLDIASAVLGSMAIDID